MSHLLFFIEQKNGFVFEAAFGFRALKFVFLVLSNYLVSMGQIVVTKKKTRLLSHFP